MAVGSFRRVRSGAGGGTAIAERGPLTDAKFDGGRRGDFGTFELMRASAERLMSCLFQAGLAADGATSTALGLIGRASGAGGGAAFGPAACWVRVS